MQKAAQGMEETGLKRRRHHALDVMERSRDAQGKNQRFPGEWIWNDEEGGREQNEQLSNSR